MSKIKCNCGNVIIDQTDNLINKAFFTRDQNIENIDLRNSTIAEFIDAYKSEKKSEWLERYFGDSTNNNLSVEEIINDILLKIELKYISVIYQCEKCNRLLVQNGNSNTFVSFIPEEKKQNDLFKGL